MTEIAGSVGEALPDCNRADDIMDGVGGREKLRATRLSTGNDVGSGILSETAAMCDITGRPNALLVVISILADLWGF